MTRSLDPVEAALSLELDDDPPKSERFDRPWIYDFDGFCSCAPERPGRVEPVSLGLAPEPALSSHQPSVQSLDQPVAPPALRA